MSYPTRLIQGPEFIFDNSFNRGKTRTFKPRKDVPEGTKQYQLRKYAEATLVRSTEREVLVLKSVEMATDALSTCLGIGKSEVGRAVARGRRLE